MSKKSKKLQKSAKTGTPAVKQEKNLVSQMEQQIQALEKRFEDFLNRGWMSSFDSDWPDTGLMAADMGMPKVDIIDKGKKLVVRAEVPGFNKDDIDVQVTDNSVTLRGTMKQESKKEEGDYFQSETRQSSFARSLALPAEVDSKNAKAKFRNGMLVIRLPKRKTAKQNKVEVG